MSLLEIFPQVIDVYPSNLQEFIARAAPPPAMWALIVNGAVQPDFSLLVDAGFTGSANSAYQLNSGIGVLEFQITENCRPIASGGQYSWIVYIQGVPLPFAYQVDINPGNVVIRDETFTTVATISHTVASGDVFRVEIAATFRLYINGALRNERTAFSGAVAYPIHYAVSLIPPVANSTARIPVPKLTGDWGLRSVVAFTAPTHGSISPLVGTKTRYSNATIPGVYTLTGQIDPTHDPNNYQRATAKIVIPPLSILGERAITLQPGQKARFRTNYDDAQNPLVTWSIVSGLGTFLNGEFTAPTAPGTTVVRATTTAGNQMVDITITIPAIVTPNYEAATPGEVINFTTNLTGTITWSATCGTIIGSGSTITWTAPNQAGLTCKITAASGALSRTYEMTVLKKFPYDPSFTISSELRKTVLISKPEDRSNRSTRVKDKDGRPYEAFEFSFKNRDIPELQGAHAFWNEHYPAKRCIIEDKLRNRRFVGYIDSDMRQEVDGDCSVDYSFRFEEG